MIGRENEAKDEANQTLVRKYQSYTEPDNSIFYICGPPGMLNAIKYLPRYRFFQCIHARPISWSVSAITLTFPFYI
jgi:NAD(P)H-flavin reductase